MYHVDLELLVEQVRQLRQLALDRGQSVRGLVTELVIKEIQEDKNQSGKEKQEEVTQN